MMSKKWVWVSAILRGGPNDGLTIDQPMTAVADQTKIGGVGGDYRFVGDMSRGFRVFHWHPESASQAVAA